MTDAPQVALAIAPTVLPTLTVLVALLLNHRQFDALNKRVDEVRLEMRDLRVDMLRESEHSRQLFTEQLRRVEEVIDARLKHLEEH